MAIFAVEYKRELNEKGSIIYRNGIGSDDHACLCTDKI